MIILPNRNMSKSKFLMPVPKKEWMIPSDYTTRDQFNNLGIRTSFHITGKIHDGHVVWRGKFEDRDDFDAFLCALANKSLKYEKDLWKLPTPEWHDGIGEHVVFEFVTTTLITATGSGTYVTPSDWNATNNTVYCIGPGGNGGASITTTAHAHAAGGGGGGYRAQVNFSAAPLTSVSYYVGAAPIITTLTGSTSSFSPGAAGANTTWNSASMVARAGGGGGGSITQFENVVGGSAGGGSGGTTGAFGGSGMNVSDSGVGTGGSSSGGTSTPNSSTSATAAGGRSGDAPAGANTGTGGASAPQQISGYAAGGTGGTGTNGGNGGSSTDNAGGGGGGTALSNVSGSGGNGGTYGAAGGGIAIRSITASRSATQGRGAQGLIAVNYTPPSVKGLFNLPILGM